MKKQVKKGISLNKLTIARIQTSKMQIINGGDCIPTDGTNWYEHSDNVSDIHCPTSDLP
ncbi:class I lanthipeptide [Dokdonia sp.]|uniref:class I lanthipeptide n=1 Tax=Dokdonia sp. TaxID=2024995 RepID=UPI00326793C6